MGTTRSGCYAEDDLTGEFQAARDRPNQSVGSELCRMGSLNHHYDTWSKLTQGFLLQEVKRKQAAVLTVRMLSLQTSRLRSL